MVRAHGGVPVDRCEPPLQLVVLGADQLPLSDETLIDESIRDQAADGRVEIITETQFWHRLGLVENDLAQIRRLYTPAMLAQLLGVSVTVIRRWHRRGLIVPAREVHRLPYFDFQEVATARRLAEMLASGATPEVIERRLEQLSRLVPDVDRPLAQLSIIVEDGDLLLRQGEGLIEPGGQMRLDFGSSADQQSDSVESDAQPTVIAAADLFGHKAAEMPGWEVLLDEAAQLEDAGNTDQAIEMYRVVLVAGGPRAEVCFRLAELLYRTGDVTAARERYSMAIELDENYVEARANLACVLAELGQTELAIAAFEGTLESHPDYPDVHYHLANLLEETGEAQRAAEHWDRFLELAPDSPWADEARARLKLPTRSDLSHEP